MLSHIFVSLTSPKCGKLGNPKMSIVYCGAPLYMHHPTPRQLQDLLTPSTAIHITIGSAVANYSL